MNYKECTSSVIFGVQWDLALKYIETKGGIQKSNLTSDSTKIGNYFDSSFILKSGKFVQYEDFSNWYDFDSEAKANLVTGKKKLAKSVDTDGVFLTTGAT